MTHNDFTHGERDSGGRTSLHYAASMNDVRVVNAIIGSGDDGDETFIDVDPRSKGGQTPLHCAATGSSPEVASILLHYGANVNARDVNGVTPLHLAAEVLGSRMITTLLLAGANPNDVTNRGMTPLHYVLSSRYAHCLLEEMDHCVNGLLDNGAFTTNLKDDLSRFTTNYYSHLSESTQTRIEVRKQEREAERCTKSTKTTSAAMH